MNKRKSPLVFLAAILASTAAWAAAATGTVNGSVNRPDGPVAGAKVVIASGSDSSYTAKATTDREGKFSFSNTPLGDVEIKVYDSQERIIATARGTLKSAGEVITLLLDAIP